MKQQVALILLLLLGSIGYSQTLDCSKIKNVKAYNPEYTNRSFTIIDGIQENYNNGVLDLAWDVKWINECEYEITCTKSIQNEFIKVGNRIVATITNVDDKCFTLKRTFYSEEFPKGDLSPSTTFCFKKD
jgi:hypothetical protein